ncbi:hypothetical protein ACTNDP_15560 [Paenibacillus barengoltzii]|uniref:hypothetical protein n=1 Tax=Paenibacillus barengoltzii TaxID=343517 RepID=UPI003F89B554
MKQQLPSVSSEETLSSSSMPVPHLPAAPIGESADAKKRGTFERSRGLALPASKSIDIDRRLEVTRSALFFR